MLTEMQQCTIQEEFKVWAANFKALNYLGLGYVQFTTACSRINLQDYTRFLYLQSVRLVTKERLSLWTEHSSDTCASSAYTITFPVSSLFAQVFNFPCLFLYPEVLMTVFFC